jgi:hypothetical protein
MHKCFDCGQPLTNIGGNTWACHNKQCLSRVAREASKMFCSGAPGCPHCAAVKDAARLAGDGMDTDAPKPMTLFQRAAKLAGEFQGWQSGERRTVRFRDTSECLVECCATLACAESAAKKSRALLATTVPCTARTIAIAELDSVLESLRGLKHDHSVAHEIAHGPEEPTRAAIKKSEAPQ